jgi:hypothetical protein
LGLHRNYLAVYYRKQTGGYMAAVDMNEKVRKTAQLSKPLAAWVEQYAKTVGASESSIIAIAVKQMRDREGCEVSVDNTIVTGGDNELAKKIGKLIESEMNKGIRNG